MTKRDYQLIADSIRESFLDVRDFGLRASNEDINEIKLHIIQNLALALRSTNPQFDGVKFIRACEQE